MQEIKSVQNFRNVKVVKSKITEASVHPLTHNMNAHSCICVLYALQILC